jgi:hypothetical protein
MHMPAALIIISMAFQAFLTWGFQELPGIIVDNPIAGQALQGVVPISGMIDPEGLVGYEVSYTYAGATTSNWFIIGQGIRSVETEPLAVWDTTLITDGDYQLQVKVNRQGGVVEDLIIPDLRVRNYSPIETETPAVQVTAVEQTQTHTPTVTATEIKMTPTAFSSNPGTVTQSDVMRSIGRGIGLTAILFIAGAIVVTLQRQKRRH